jgi:uncharacterized membrane protein HdeD (DUF308 family)
MEPTSGLSHYLRDIRGIREKWWGFLIMGLLLALLGIVVINHSVTATLFSVALFGALVAAAGVIQIIQAFWAQKWTGVLLSILVGLLYLVAGAYCLAKPAVSAMSLTLMIGMFLIVAGIFRMFMSLWYRFDQWGWFFINGLITLILGFLILANWPVAGLWVIGLFLGIDLLVAGIVWVMISLKARLS